MTDDLAESTTLISRSIERERHKMKGKLRLLLGDDDLMAAFVARQRDKLADKASPVMSTLRDQGFTHFYFIDPKLKVFFRAHQPERHGDTLKRATARKAQRTMQPASGIEMGVLGTLTLRVVAPLSIDGKPEGFIELGKELTSIVHEVHQDIDVQALLAMHKSDLSQTSWQEGAVLSGYHYAWQSFADYAVMDHEHELDLAAYAAAIKLALAGNIERWHEVNGTSVSVSAQPLKILSGGQDIMLVALRDVSDLIASYHQRQTQTAYLLALLLLIGIVLIWAAMARADRRLYTYHAEMERAVAERTAELSASNHELESFAYAVSHDLRAPLRTMDGFSEALLQDYAMELDAQGAHFLERIRAGSQRMAQMIDALLRLSRVSRREMALEAVSLSEICTKSLQNLHQQQPEREMESHVQPDVRVMGDWMLLSIALENLLSNAWKFTAGRHPAQIEFGAERRQGELVCWIKDNGAGFDPAYADKLFGAFQRLHTQDEFEGIGIGLATVQRIVSRHAGRVWAEGSPDQGATFFMAFPDATGDS